MSPAGLLWGSKGTGSVKALWSLSHYPNTCKGSLLLGGTPTRMDQILRGDKEESGRGCDHRNGALGEYWGALRRQRAPRGDWDQQVQGNRVWSTNPERLQLGPGEFEMAGLKTSKRKRYFEKVSQGKSLIIKRSGHLHIHHTHEIFTAILGSLHFTAEVLKLNRVKKPASCQSRKDRAD